MIQEGLTTAARHARVRHVQVTVEPADGRLRCIMEDDGVGFEVATEGAEGWPACGSACGQPHPGTAGPQEAVAVPGGCDPVLPAHPRQVVGRGPMAGQPDD
ncbi:MAG: hypothetical protein QN210_02965 [Armatimonadota bacterium]|nr:hypothetical protein [Armatimonadota bacterium]MDR7611364.1 hypothetical protein [Armatimonadota bacterium]